jgi:predicted RNA-binding Zn ribbon-like protein
MVCIINPITNRAVRTDTKLGKKLVKLADDIEDEIKAENKIKAAAKRALKQKEFKNVKQASSKLRVAIRRTEVDKAASDNKKAGEKLTAVIKRALVKKKPAEAAEAGADIREPKPVKKATTKKATTKTAPAPTPMGAAGGNNDKYKYLDVLDDDELGFAMMHYYRKNYKGDNPWTSFLAKPRSSLMYTIKKNDIKLSVKKPLDAQPKGDELNPDEIKRLKFKREMMELYKKK